MSESRGIFRLVLYTPRAKLLECRLKSLVLPAHDGQIGILRNHSPMLCKLGMGIMQAHGIVSGVEGQEEAYFLIDGGFCRVSENFVLILASDVTSFGGMGMEEVEKMVSEAKKLLHGDKYNRQLRHHDVEKASLMVHLAEMAGMNTEAM